MIELEALQALTFDIKNLGASLIAISPQIKEDAKDDPEKIDLRFPILSDVGNKVAAQFGLVFELPDDLKALYNKFGIDLEKSNGNPDWTLPMPARFIIDQQGIIVDSQVNTDYTKRPEPLGILTVLKNINPVVS